MIGRQPFPAASVAVAGSIVLFHLLTITSSVPQSEEFPEECALSQESVERGVETLHPVEQHTNAEGSPTRKAPETTKKPVITKCWECLSYHEGTLFTQCPMNDTVDPTRTFLGNCTGACMTHTDDRNPQLVVRGCTATQWGLPPLPDDGCYPYYSEIWCICRSDGCNGVKLDFANIKSKQLDYLVDYSHGSNSPNSAPCLPQMWGPVLLALPLLGKLINAVLGFLENDD